MVLVKSHPLAEIIAKKLFGITTVPPTEQKRMVNRAIKAAVQWYEEQKEGEYGSTKKG